MKKGKLEADIVGLTVEDVKTAIAEYVKVKYNDEKVSEKNVRFTSSLQFLGSNLAEVVLPGSVGNSYKIDDIT